MTTTVPDLLHRRLAADPGRPLITFYDDATGERVELSALTFDNHVTKTANYYTDELMLDPGDRVHIDLPPHWQSMVTAMAAWVAGLTVTFDPEQDSAVHVVGPHAVEMPEHPSGEVLACSLRPMSGRFTTALPAGWHDFADEVPPQPDVLVSPAATAVDPAVADATESLTHQELLDRALTCGHDIGLGAGDRLLTDANPASIDGTIAALLAPLTCDASVVLVAHLDTSLIDAKTRQERTTCVHWSSS